MKGYTTLFDSKEKSSGFLFSLVVVIYFGISLISFIITKVLGLNEDENGYKLLSYIFTAIAGLITVVVFCFFKGEKPFRKVDFKPFKKRYLVLSFTLFLGVFFGLGKLNIIFAEFLASLGVNVSGSTLPLDNIGWLIICIIVVALLPAFFEEVLFRGYIFNGLKGFSTWQIVLISGFIFSLFHASLAQIFYQFIGGMIFALLTLKAGSIFPAIIMHFLNNLLIIVLTYFFPTVEFFNVITVSVGAVLLLGSLAYLIFFDKRNFVKEGKARDFFKYASFGIVYYLLIWIVEIISYV